MGPLGRGGRTVASELENDPVRRLSVDGRAGRFSQRAPAPRKSQNELTKRGVASVVRLRVRIAANSRGESQKRRWIHFLSGRWSEETERGPGSDQSGRKSIE
jgi:hypothetical protein